MKVWIYTHDPMLTLCYLPDEAKELFGDDALDDAGPVYDVPDELAIEINNALKKIKELSRKLERKINLFLHWRSHQKKI